MRGRRAFTLLEIVVAMTLSGLAVSLAVAVFTTVSDGIATADRRAASWDRDQNALRWLTQAFASAEAGGFQGGAERAAFGTWLWSAEGWLTPTTVTFAFEDSLLVATAGGRAFALIDSVAGIRFEYLSGIGADSPWLRTWSSQTSVPTAVRLTVARSSEGHPADTILFFIGGRG